MLASTQPYIRRKYELPSETCKGNIPKDHQMEPLEKIYVNEVMDDIKQNDFVLFIQHNYTPFQSERVYKNTLIKNGGIFRSHRNVVYKEVFKRLGVDDKIQQLFVTRNSIVIGQVDKLPACVGALRKMPQFILLGGCIDGEIYNYEDLQSISRQQNIDLCRANLLAVLETPLAELSYCLEQYISNNQSEEGKDGDDDPTSQESKAISSNNVKSSPEETGPTNKDDGSSTNSIE